MPDKFERQGEILANRVKKRFKHLRKRFSRQQIDVFRLYDWDIPEIRAVVDWYAGHLVIGEYARRQSTPDWLPMMGAAVAQALAVTPDKVYLKTRYCGVRHGKRYERIDHSNQMFTVSERDLQFYVNPSDFVDTGLFSDHRNTRQMIRQQAAGKDFLNLFCYTGTFTCYAAKGGARSSVSVDRSKTAISWAEKNMTLNGLAGKAHHLVQAHTFDFLAKAKRNRQQFDLAVVDPPSFYTIRTKEDRFDVVQEHPHLLSEVVGLIRQGGVVVFSTNHQDFTPRLDQLKVSKVKEITAITIPEDYLHKRKKIHRCWEITV